MPASLRSSSRTRPARQDENPDAKDYGFYIQFTVTLVKCGGGIGRRGETGRGDCGRCVTWRTRANIFQFLSVSALRAVL